MSQRRPIPGMGVQRNRVRAAPKPVPPKVAALVYSGASEPNSSPGVARRGDVIATIGSFAEPAHHPPRIRNRDRYPVRSASVEQMSINDRHVPPIGVHLTQDIANRHGRFRARARWSDPTSHERRSYSAPFDREAVARMFLKQIQSRTHIASDPLDLARRLHRRDRGPNLRGLDPSSIASGSCG